MNEDAQAEPTPEGVDLTAPSAVTTAGTTIRGYRSEYYKKNNSWGVKQTFAARRQIFSVGGQTSQKSKAALKKIVDKAIQDMENGASEEDTKIWVRNEASK